MSVRTGAELERLVGRLSPVSLDVLDERSALQRRIDTKYVVPVEEAAEAIERLADDHEVLDIDGRRVFRYESVYFDTPRLDCFTDQVSGKVPRYKVRSRLYVDSRQCSFEVKLKLSDEETAKQHGPCAPEEHGRLGPGTRRFVDDTLREARLGAAPDDLGPALVTRFERATLVARNGSERITFDIGLTLERPNDGAARIRDGLVVVEVKTPDGDGPADRLLAEVGTEPVSLSKYRAGIALLAGPGAADAEREEDRRRWFEIL